MCARISSRSRSTALDGLESVRKEVSALKSRGVTRFLDLRKLNKQNLDDVEEDEQVMDEDLDEPEIKRLRILELPPTELYEPSPTAEAEQDDATPQQEENRHPRPARLRPWRDWDYLHLCFRPTAGSEPSVEPEPVPAEVDEHTSQAFAPPRPGETFQAQRLRLDRQETMSFGPQRRGQSGAADQGPYHRARAEEENMNFAFNVEEIDDKALPPDWFFNAESGYVELRRPVDDFWEIKAGCLIRHHLRPRWHAFAPHGCKDLPVAVTSLDSHAHLRYENLYRRRHHLHGRLQGRQRLPEAVQCEGHHVDRADSLSDQRRCTEGHVHECQWLQSSSPC